MIQSVSMMVQVDYFERLGGKAIRKAESVRGIVALLVAALRRMPVLRRASIRPVLYRQIYFTGIEAFSIIAVMGVLIGIAIITQVTNLAGLNPLLIGKILVWTVVRELGPIFAAIIIIARSSSAVASELGAMKAGKEIDRLWSMGIDPLEYLIVPRIAGSALSLFILTFYFQVTAVAGGLVLSSLIVDTPIIPQLQGIFSVLGLFEMTISLVKSVVFGIVIGTVSCYHGLSVKQSITEIPQVTSRAVLQSLTMVFVLNVVITVFSFIW